MTETLAERYVKAIQKGNLGLAARLEDELDAETQAENAKLNAPDLLLKSALWYARRSIPVFPCEPRGKKPLTTHGFKDASTDRAVIQAWWTATPAANIGTPTGLTFDVIDVDGREGIRSMYAKNINLPPEIGHSVTARDAGHHIFITPTGRGNKASFLPGVDFRGAGGYVILAPSVGASGRRYRWTKQLQVAP